MAVRRRLPLRDELRDVKWALRYFASAEMATPVRLRSPRMLVRGFRSDRRWLLPAGASRRNGYIADLPYARRAHRMNPDSVQSTMNDKIVFAEVLEQRGLAASAPRTLGVLRSGVWTARPGGDPGRCIVKPACGSGGSGVRPYDSLESASAAVLATGEDHVVQELVQQHPDSAALWPASLNTVRVLAVRTPDGRVVLPRAVQRIGRSTTGAVDNYSSGGLVAWVDLDDGTVGPMMSKVERPGRRLFVDHPDTGVRLTGRVVPHWPAMVELVLALMEAFPEAVHVGWDMAVGTDGPLVIEGNARFVGVQLYQMHGPFTTDPGVRDHYRSWGLLP